MHVILYRICQRRVRATFGDRDENIFFAFVIFCCFFLHFGVFLGKEGLYKVRWRCYGENVISLVLDKVEGTRASRVAGLLQGVIGFAVAYLGENLPLPHLNFQNLEGSSYQGKWPNQCSHLAHWAREVHRKAQA